MFGSTSLEKETDSFNRLELVPNANECIEKIKKKKFSNGE